MAELMWIMTKGGACGGRADALPNENFIPAPEGGGFGMRWTGSAWVPDETADAEVEAAMLSPEAALAAEREAMSCTRLQAMLALGEASWSTVSAALAAQPWEVRARFQDAAEWRRLNPLVAMLGQQVLGLTDAQMDDLFRLAVTL